MMDLIPLIGALGVGGLLVGILTQWMTNKRERATRHAQFRKQQLEQFYGPLLAMHREIRARSDLRVKLQHAIDDLHMRDMIHAAPGGVERASDAHLPSIMTNIKDENHTFRKVLMPCYRDMISLFREKMWLAEPETREYFAPLIEFVDVWDKILDDKLPRAVAPAVGHTEQNLEPFYCHLEAIHDRLRKAE